MSDDPSTPRLNRLSEETSPYLLQHATNPVDWYPWGDEALARARAQEKPILLSVGYSSCHWCHVMAHESFEDEATAELMNKSFINIKVDREERPDIDSVYMTAVQAMTGQGGWPMTLFLTPELEPFFAGTYFPPEDGHGRPSFSNLLRSLGRAWEEDREAIHESAAKVTTILRDTYERDLSDETELSLEASADAVTKISETFDEAMGGFSQAPKFPVPQHLEFLFAFAARVGRGEELGDRAATMALRTLDSMASGGIYDQLGGGFARYSVDREWVVPHFEKMLYDNAQLVRAYVHGFQWTGSETYRRVVEETLSYLAGTMRHPDGGFFAAEDADSEGIEGKFYVWSLAEMERELGKDAAFAAACLGVSGQGNFSDPHNPELRGRSVLTRRFDRDIVAARFEVEDGELDAKLDDLRARLLASRDERVRPGLDDKVLASWNGLAMAAFAEAGRVLREDRFVEIARLNAEFLQKEMWRDGRLLHSWKDGRAKVAGMLEDYTYVGLGLVELFKATGEVKHLEWAQQLMDVVGENFHDEERGGFFETAHGSEDLLVRTKDYYDQAAPAGNSAAALLLVWLSRYFEIDEYEAAASDAAVGVAKALTQAPGGLASMWQAVEFLAAPRTEIVLSGAPSARVPFEDVVANYFLPWVAIAPTEAASGLPMFEGREAGDEAVAYLCQDMVCELPARSPEQLKEQLLGSV